MKTEYEATFYPININEMRQSLKKVGAKLIKKKFLMKRRVFYPPQGIEKGWMRVRNEGDKITMAYKYVGGNKNKITDQKEIEIEINDFSQGCEFLKTIGCTPKSYQENKREIWQYKNIEICLDTWPALKTLIEIEGKNLK